jgi:predicted phosphodiesterase
MRLAVLADVHANLPALEAVLADLPAVDALACAGDIVGYGPHPAACVDRLREWDGRLLAVQGNHDRAVAAGADLGNGMAGAGVRHAREELDADALAWLDGLPPVREAFDGRLRVAHGHPEDPDRYVYPSLFDASLLADERVLVLGHTHVQACERFERPGWGGPERRLVLNPGSVGQPRDGGRAHGASEGSSESSDGDPDAAYATLALDDDPEATLHRVPYDVERTVRDIQAAGLPAAAGDRLRKGV